MRASSTSVKELLFTARDLPDGTTDSWLVPVTAHAPTITSSCTAISARTRSAFAASIARSP